MRTSNRLKSRRLELHAQAKRHDPVTLDHEDAKWDWLHMIALSSLPATTRLIAHTLCLHGRSNGSNIYPSVRGLADEAGLTETAICKHLGLLTSEGYLLPFFQKGRTGQSWARTTYHLTLPRIEFDRMKTKPWKDDPTWTSEKGTQRRKARSLSSMALVLRTLSPRGDKVGLDTAITSKGTPPREAPSSKIPNVIDVAGGSLLDRESERGTSREIVPRTLDGTEGTQRDEKGTPPDAEGTQRRVEKALNGVESSLTSESHNLVSHMSVRQDAPRASTANPEETLRAKAAEQDERKRVSITRLLKAGTDEADIVRYLGKSQGVTPDDVRRAVQEAM